MELCLERLNQRHVRAHAGAVPEAFKDTVDPATYAKAVEYTLAKSRFSQVEAGYDALVVLAALFSGLLPGFYGAVVGWLGGSVWAAGGALFIIGVTLALAGLPLEWHAQFHLEARFGFNTTTPRLWWLDRLKGLLLGLGLGYPLLALILKLVDWTGPRWWLWAWACVLGVQLLMAVLAPVLILPLFNKFTPLPEGALRERLLALARKTNFRVRSIQVMDGSKRSRHSNAFFTGFGRFRKIALFDTLVEQLAEAELAAVLAHEIGHFKKKHVVKMLALSAAGLLAGLCLVSWLAGRAWFYRAFGFAPGSLAPAFLVFGLVSGAATFWLSPLVNLWSRHCEYQADGFAAAAMGEPGSLISALRKLSQKNLNNVTPHPLYSGFHYSHPTLLERERALRQRA